MVEKIQHTIEDFRAVVARADVAVPTVSEWTVGMHVHHCCLSMIGISKTLRKSTPPAPRAHPSLQRSVVLMFGFIPRGRAKTPSVVVPSASVTTDDLVKLLDEAVKRIGEANGLDRGQWFKHPLLGIMDRDAALKFVLVHNRHHLRIVGDILAHRA